MTSGLPCGRPDGHPGKHYSAEAMERRRARDRQREPGTPTDETRALAREANRRYREKDPERTREKTRRWRAANLDQARAGTRENVRRWREANPDESREIAARHRGGLKKAVLDHYGNVCACCGTTDRLTIDHVNGDGDEHRARVGGGWAIYRWLVRNGFPEGFQTLCRPCNASKKRGARCRLEHEETA